MIENPELYVPAGIIKEVLLEKSLGPLTVTVTEVSTPRIVLSSLNVNVTRMIPEFFLQVAAFVLTAVT